MAKYYTKRTGVKEMVCRKCGDDFTIPACQKGNFRNCVGCRKKKVGKIEKKCENCSVKFNAQGKGCRAVKNCDKCKPIVKERTRKECDARNHAKRAKLRGNGITPDPDELIFYGYKNPLRRLKPSEGFGYDGVVLYSKDAKKIQCHICGKLYSNVGSHSFFSHGLKAKDYKKKFNLSQKTALVGEKTRTKLIKAHDGVTHGAFSHKGKTKKQVQAHMLSMSKKGASKSGCKGWTLEKRNEMGMCPQQLVAKIKKLEKKLGRRPTAKEYSKEYRSYQSVLTVFGTWNKAIKVAGLTTFNEEASITSDPKYLLEQMRVFYKQNNRTPRTSDANRGLIPYVQAYCDVFGTMNNARIQAGIPVLLQISKYRYDEVLLPETSRQQYIHRMAKMPRKEMVKFSAKLK